MKRFILSIAAILIGMVVHADTLEGVWGPNDISLAPSMIRVTGAERYFTSTNTSPAGTATVTFNVTKPGDYYFMASVRCATALANSVLMAVDRTPASTNVCTFSVTGTNWAYQGLGHSSTVNVTNTFTLAAGAHYLSIVGRETNTQIQCVALYSKSPTNTLSVILGWNTNSEPNLAGYRVYAGTQSRNYTIVKPTSKTMEFLANLQPSTKYYFAVTATNLVGLESAYSAEVSATTPSPGVVPTTPILLRVRP